MSLHTETIIQPFLFDLEMTMQKQNYNSKQTRIILHNNYLNGFIINIQKSMRHLVGLANKEFIPSGTKSVLHSNFPQLHRTAKTGCWLDNWWILFPILSFSLEVRPVHVLIFLQSKQENVNTRNISGISLCWKKKANQGWESKLQARTLTRLVCGFVASLPVQIFTVIGHNTRNIPEIFQVFPCFTVTTGWVRQMTNTKCLSFYGITIFQGKNVALLRCKLTSVYVHVYVYYNWGGLEMRNYLPGYILGPFQETSCHSKFQFQFYTELLKMKRIQQFMAK